MTNPARIHLISEIPEPAAYFANDRTRCAERNEKSAYGAQSMSIRMGCNQSTHSERDVDEPFAKSEPGPVRPSGTSAVFVGFNLPAAELLVQPPAVRAVAHLEVGEPYCQDGDQGSVHSYADP